MRIEIITSRYIPGDGGKLCRYNGRHYSVFGNKIECECDGCEYILCCVEMVGREKCGRCRDVVCPCSVGYRKLGLEKFAAWLSGER